jgi:23S rRNA (cytosine1962-C5)-methyltransferase|tara:strand:+ start:264 stop:635 length:372 start_codon:yes stop_codon:yes gene_type:complete
VNKLFKETLANFFSLDQPEARRVLHGRGLLFSSLEQLSVDWYPPVLCVTAYKEFEGESGLEEFAMFIDRQQQIKSLVLQKRYEENSPAQDLIGNELDKTIVQEGELFFEIRPGMQQNTGLFLQ